MTTTTLEHVNVTVQDPDKTAAMLCQLFDWQIRWEGSSIHGGRSVHVGTPEQYLAVYSMPKLRAPKQVSYEQIGGLNHLGVHVDDLNAVEQRVLAAGYKTFNHGDYEPGRRFYFRDDDNIEFEVLSYAGEKT
ncbi:MAG: VOC family protein [Gammaproteobacteria bacterium]